jgi:hypothetical protein
MCGLPGELCELIFPPITGSFVCKFLYYVLSSKREVLLDKIKTTLIMPPFINKNSIFLPNHGFIIKYKKDNKCHYNVRFRDYCGPSSFLFDNKDKKFYEDFTDYILDKSSKPIMYDITTLYNFYKKHTLKEVDKYAFNLYLKNFLLNLLVSNNEELFNCVCYMNYCLMHNNESTDLNLMLESITKYVKNWFNPPRKRSYPLSLSSAIDSTYEHVLKLSRVSL